MLFRTFLFFWWGSYEVFSKILKEKTTMLWAGGLSAQVFWLAVVFEGDLCRAS